MLESVFASLIATALYDGIKSNLQDDPVVVQEQVVEQKGIEWHIVSKETKK
tara:strand:+ start:2535 stop:2687 length:153 start_codon:yes stop_codon:yes gene_type:complete